MNEENWLEEITSVPDRMNHVEMPSALLDKIKAIPESLEAKLETIPVRTILFAAASITVLIAINVLLFSGGNSGSANDPLMDSYFNYTKHI